MDEFVFVDSDIVVFNKPAGMPSHPLKDGAVKNTALDVVVAKYPEVANASSHQLEGGLVHRLDNNTSGLLLFARHHDAYILFRDLIQNQKIQKTYLALAQGHIAHQMVFEQPIAHHSKNKKKMAALKEGDRFFRGQAQAAKTFIEPIAWGENATLLQVKIEGGRRHQIRVHLAAAGHPLIGDELYKGLKATYLPGHALHADTIVLPSGLKLTAPVPDPFKNEAAKYGIGF